MTPSTSRRVAITRVAVERWRVHLEAARAQGKTIRDYAAEHGLSPHSLYAAGRALRAQAASGSPFATAQLTTDTPGLRAELPNGVLLQWSACSPTQASALLAALAAPPCSR